MTEQLLRRLRELTAIDAVSGDERPLVRYLADQLTAAGVAIAGDASGNLYAVRRGKAPGPTLLVAAHMDEIGLMVKSVDRNGFIRFEKVGGMIDSLLPARVVRVNGVTGVIGVKAGHYQTEQERNQVKRHTEMYIDIGCDSAEAVAKLGIRIGDPITIVSPLVEMGGNPHLVAGKAVDNRLGCAVLLELVLSGAVPEAGTLVAAFTVQEEVGLKGAEVAAHRWHPELALALDTMPSGDTPDMNYEKDLNVSIGAGPAIQVMGGPGGRGNLLHPVVREFLRETAAESQIPVQFCTFTGGNNDSSTMAWAAEGCAAGSITLPRRYSHSPVEVADLRDAVAAQRLLEAVLARMDRLPTFTFLPEMN
ncbi:MAG: M42 family metallopeptidase [Mycobacterium leprae]